MTTTAPLSIVDPLKTKREGGNLSHVSIRILWLLHSLDRNQQDLDWLIEQVNEYRKQHPTFTVPNDPNRLRTHLRKLKRRKWIDIHAEGYKKDLFHLNAKGRKFTNCIFDPRGIEVEPLSKEFGEGNTWIRLCVLKALFSTGWKTASEISEILGGLPRGTIHLGLKEAVERGELHKLKSGRHHLFRYTDDFMNSLMKPLSIEELFDSEDPKTEDIRSGDTEEAFIEKREPKTDVENIVPPPFLMNVKIPQPPNNEPEKTPIVMENKTSTSVFTEIYVAVKLTNDLPAPSPFNQAILEALLHTKRHKGEYTDRIRLKLIYEFLDRNDFSMKEFLTHVANLQGISLEKLLDDIVAEEMNQARSEKD